VVGFFTGISQASQSTIQKPEILGFAGNVASVLPIETCPLFSPISTVGKPHERASP
jgi:hypothetical protein